MTAALVASASSSIVAEAREPERLQIELPAGTLPEVIAELSRETGASIGAEGPLPRLRTPAIHGTMTVGEALARLLAGSDYVARRVGNTAWRIERLPPLRSVLRPQLPPPPPASRPLSLDTAPIIVTGAKREQALLDLPMAISTVQFPASRRLDPTNDTTTVADEIDGMALTGLGPGRNRVFLRGIADSPFNGESQTTVAVLLDDARLTYAAPDPDIRLVDIERVEVLKGPQGSLYGTGTLGGIYHIVSRHADPQASEFAVSGGTELLSGRIGYSGSAVANLPFAQHRAALRLVGYSALEPGWVDTGARHDANHSRTLGARAELGVEAGGGWRLDVTGFAQWLETRDSQYVYSAGARSRPAQFPEPHDNDLRHVSVRLAREAGSVDIVLSSGMTWHEVDDTLDATIGAGSFGLANPQLLYDSRVYRVWDSEARASGLLGPLNWLFGLSHVWARQSVLWTLHSATDALTIDDDRRTATDSAAFGDVTVPISKRLRLDLGARLFRSTLVETRLVSGASDRRERGRTDLTPSAALSWQVSPRRLVFLRYGSAFRQGGSDVTPSGELQTLRSDELATIEAGWREDLGRGLLDIGVYYTWWRHLQSDLLQPDGRIETANVGDARIFGAEASLDVALGGDWHARAGATLASALLVHNTLGIELHDRRLPVVPRYTLRGSLRRDLRIGSADASLQVQLRYTGPARLSFDPVIDRPMGNVLDSRIEARAALDGFDLALVVDNVFDLHADSFAFGNSLRFATLRQYTPQPPRSVSVSVLRRF